MAIRTRVERLEQQQPQAATIVAPIVELLPQHDGQPRVGRVTWSSRAGTFHEDIEVADGESALAFEMRATGAAHQLARNHKVDGERMLFVFGCLLS